jgi:hypothetical protein
MILRHASYGHPHGLVSSDPHDLSPEGSASLTDWSRVGSYDSAKESKKGASGQIREPNALRLVLQEGRKAVAGARDLLTPVFDLPPLIRIWPSRHRIREQIGSWQT